MRVAFKNFGCRANNFETDTLYLEAIRRGMQVVSDADVADAYVINSCTVTASADRDARNQVYRCKRLNPESRVAVIGCYAQVSKEELLDLPGVDYVLGTADKFNVLDLIQAPDSTANTLVSDATGSLSGSRSLRRDYVMPATGFLPETFLGSRNARANIKIQDGCNYRCAFCTIPKARGRSRSLAPKVVENQIREAAAQGFREVVLTGIHLAHYGWEFNSDLKGLVETLVAMDSGPRIRLSTLDPFEIPDGLLELMRDNRRLCPFVHIALQSGDDKILQRMRRLYLAREFITVTEDINSRIPDAFIGVDVIVGFPGETESSFENTLQLLEQTPWAKLHVFSYSERAGTEAVSLDGKVAPAEIADRSRILRKLSDTRYRKFLDSQIGTTRNLLLERRSKTKPDFWMGHTENYVPVEAEVPDGMTKEIRPVCLTGVSRATAIGRCLA